MSEYELDDLGELEEFDGEYVAEAFDPTLMEGATPSPGSSVTSRFFHPDGSLKETPELQSQDALVASFQAQERVWEAEEAAQGPSALEEPDPGAADWQVAEADLAATLEAQLRAQAAQYEAWMLERARELGGSSVFNVRDPEALKQVAGQAQAEVAAWWQSQLAQGASVRQRESAMSSPQFAAWLDSKLEAGLEDAAHLQRVRNTEARRHAERAWERDSLAYQMGIGPPPKAVWDRPSIAKMAAKMAPYAQRQAERNAELAAITERNQYWHDVNRSAYERARPKPRKLGS